MNNNPMLLRCFCVLDTVRCLLSSVFCFRDWHGGFLGSRVALETREGWKEMGQVKTNRFPIVPVFLLPGMGL